METKSDAPFHLPYATAVENARKAYLEGRLTAQHPDPAQRHCVYTRGEYGCAIGVSLPLDLAVQFQDGQTAPTTSGGISGFKIRNRLTSDNYANLIHLQALHDEWCNSSREGRSFAADKEKKFKELIGL